MTSTRHYSRTDHFLSRISDGLRAFDPLRARGQAPAMADNAEPLAADSARQAASLMRVNHAGEVAAQGLYQGQALFARDPHVRRQLLDAAEEERQHLQWCETRLRELGDGPSKLSPLWYAGSFAIGAAAGLAGDEKSLGFVAETERQVSEHLGEHLHKLPSEDAASRAVVQRMQQDEERHGEQALQAGGALPPPPVRRVMRLVAGVMKFAAARI